jgi:hypothetical protein
VLSHLVGPPFWLQLLRRAGGRKVIAARDGSEHGRLFERSRIRLPRAPTIGIVRIFLAGATGILGERLVPLLVADGHPVAGLTRSPDKAAGGVVLRYGKLYRPGTYFEHKAPAPPRIHVDEAARRTVAALDAHSGVLTIVEAPHACGR